MMEPWMDESAATTDALFPRFVCRVSGAPVDTVDTLRAERTLSLLDELAEVEARISERREEVSRMLFEAIGATTEKPVRNRLVALKRELYNGRAPAAQKVNDTLAAVDEATGQQVRAFVADLERARELNATIGAAHDEEVTALRRRFRELVRDGDFRKGLMVSSRALYGNLGRYDAAAERGTLSGRDEKTERGLLRYYTRMAAKATPFATFCAVIPGTFVDAGADQDEGRIRFTGDPRAKRSFVRINKFLYGLVFDHLKTRPTVRHRLAIEPNPTLRKEDGRLVFLTAIDGREVFQRMAENEVLDLIADRCAQAGRPTLGDLIGALCGDPEIEATPEEAEAYLDKLIEIGFLRFHTGIREQDADWDLPFRELLERIDDEHARRTSQLLGVLRERVEAYGNASVDGRGALIDEIHALIESALVEMEISGRLRRDMPFYEDATAAAGAEIALTPGVRRAFGAWEEWARLTSSLGWPRAEQATMRHFYQTYYGDSQGVPLLRFYEEFYREHFKAHVEKEAKQRGGAPKEALGGYDVRNPFGLDVIRSLSAARIQLGEAFRERWEAEPDAAVVDLTADDVRQALAGVETVSDVPRSMGAFGLLVPAEEEGGAPSFVLHGGSYTAGYGKYFSRFLYMLPDDVQEDVRTWNAALTDDMLAEICGDAQFNANLHPPLMRWEISYPTGESGATEAQLPSSEIVVQPDPDDPYALRLAHGPTGRRVIPVDLGFLNPQMRPPLYQLLSRFTPPVMFAPTVPESHAQPAHGHEARPATVEGLQVTPAVVAQDGGGADTVDQGADTVDQGADTVAANPFGADTVDGGADTVDGGADTVAAGADTVDGGADTVDGGADTVDAGADTVAAAAAPADAAHGHAQPQPTISYRPRLTFGGSLVLSRRRWSVPGTLLPQRRTDESAAEFFVRLNRWRRESGIPETGYFRINPIPEPRPTPAGQPAPAQAEAPPEVVDEIPGYEGAAEPEAEAHEDEQEHEAEPAAGEAGAPAAAGAAPQRPKPTQASRDFYKPQFMDFGNPLLVAMLGRTAAGLKRFQVVFEERLPDRDGLPRHGDDRFVTELVVQLAFPRGTAAAPSEAASEPALATG
jgi:hypothetical protein